MLALQDQFSDKSVIIINLIVRAIILWIPYTGAQWKNKKANDSVYEHIIDNE
jgi:hypothetical protein